MTSSTIPAANNLTIHLEDEAWRLYNGRADGQALVEASAAGLTYVPAFAQARRLSSIGRLNAADITMVVVGWAAEDASWHLGVLLAPDVAQARGGRWCGLARWTDQQGTEADQAGQALSTTLNKPFRLVPPEDETVEEEVEQEETAPADWADPITTGGAVTADALETTLSPQTAIAIPSTSVETIVAREVIPMALPISFGHWLLHEDVATLVLERSRGWRNEILVRAVFFIVVAPIFGVLSIGAMLSSFAPMQPQWLPWVGLGLSLIMLLNALAQLFTLFRAPRVVIDTRLKMIKQMVRGRKMVQAPFEGLAYVLISQSIHQRQAIKGRPTVDAIAAEAWLHVFSPRRGFIELCHAEHLDGQIAHGMDFKARRELDLRDIDTAAHHAGLAIGRALNVPVYIEER